MPARPTWRDVIPQSLVLTLPVVQHDRRNFLAHVAPWVTSEAHVAIGAGIDHVLEWTATKGSGLAYREPGGKDPLLGAAFADGSILLWGIYPRQGDGGKVTLFPGSAARLAPDTHRALANQLEQLQPGLRLGPNQNLCMSLQRLSHPRVWTQYRAVLEEAYAQTSAFAPRKS